MEDFWFFGNFINFQIKRFRDFRIKYSVTFYKHNVLPAVTKCGIKKINFPQSGYFLAVTTGNTIQCLRLDSSVSSFLDNFSSVWIRISI